MKASILNSLKGRKYWILGTLLVIVTGGYVLSSNGNGKLETISMERADLVRTVKVAGKVVPLEKVDLGFEIAGTVASVGKTVGSEVSKGEVLVRLAAGGLQADLTKAEAELAKLEGSQDYENSIANARRALTQSILSAYSDASDAVLNKADQVFVKQTGRDPKLVGTPTNSSLAEVVEKERIAIGYMFLDWQKLISTLYTSTYTEAQLAETKKYLDRTAVFLTNVSSVVNQFETTSALTQALIDSYKSVLLSARDSVSAAKKDIITKESSLASLIGDVPVQVATVMNLQFQLSKTSLISPISGIVSKQDAKVGQAVSLGTQLVSVVSKENIVEAFVPEVSLPGLRVGQSAEVVLEAYGKGVTFLATVSHIDPAETVRDGVSTYKVKLAFGSPDERVRSGMTANIAIETQRKPSVNLLLERAVVREGGETYVYLLNGSERVRQEVTLGEKDSSGRVEVLSGLSASDKVVLNPK